MNAQGCDRVDFRARRKAVVWGLSALALPFAAWSQVRPGSPLVEVWKSPTCGCCKDWVTHLETQGFRVRVHDTGNTAIRAGLGIDIKYGSCHTAQVGGYAIEGHVPAPELKRLLSEKPQAIGLAVPGMPVGSPGMEFENRIQPFDVIAFGPSGQSVFASYP